MNIVFNINPLGLEGLGATIVSLLRNCSDDSRLKIYVLCSRLKHKDKRNLRLLLRREKFRGSYEFIDYNADESFGHLLDFSGDYTTYGKLLIPQLVPEKVVLYLDSDLIVEADVLELEGFDFGGEPIAAVPGSTINFVLDRQFLVEKLHWSENTIYFNAGILLFDLDRWRETDMDAKWELLTHKYPRDFISHDQTIFNSLSEGKFARLPIKFNVAWPPGTVLPETSDSITHFIGSPKPWDVLGNRVHAGYNLWRAFNPQDWFQEYSCFSVRRVRRSWNIRRNTVRQLITMVKSR